MSRIWAFCNSAGCTFFWMSTGLLRGAAHPKIAKKPAETEIRRILRQIEVMLDVSLIKTKIRQNVSPFQSKNLPRLGFGEIPMQNLWFSGQKNALANGQVVAPYCKLTKNRKLFPICQAACSHQAPLHSGYFLEIPLVSFILLQALRHFFCLASYHNLYYINKIPCENLFYAPQA
ncbi:hypothetical protein KKG05_01725 [bacterium]|nr:hypothetical protein [bacterium]